MIMTEKTKHTLKAVGKGAVLTLLTAGGYFVAKGTLHVILNHLEPPEQKSRKPERASAKKADGSA
jgi:hypothetical protein